MSPSQGWRDDCVPTKDQFVNVQSIFPAVLDSDSDPPQGQIVYRQRDVSGETSPTS
jgi:hypothetical protein